MWLQSIAQENHSGFQYLKLKIPDIATKCDNSVGFPKSGHIYVLYMNHDDE